MIAVSIAIFGLIWFAVAERQPELTAVQNGRRFSPAERRQVEHTLRNADISGVQYRGKQVLVPVGTLEAADSALAELNTSVAVANTPTSTNSLLDQFATGRRQERAEAADRAAKLGRLLAQLPEIETAEIVWDEEPGISRRQAPRVLATVFLKPEEGKSIGPETVEAVRSAVAGSRAYLAATDVAVMDLKRNITYRGDVQSPGTSIRERDVAAEYRDRIAAALADIAGLQVAVSLRPVNQAVQVPPRRDPFAGLSGPNLRLEVVPVTPPSGRIADATVAPGPDSSPARQLSVTIEVPVEHVIAAATGIANGRSAALDSRKIAAFREYVRRSVESDVRDRVAAVATDLPAEIAGSEVTVHLAMPADAQWPLPAGSAASAISHWDWSRASSRLLQFLQSDVKSGWGLVVIAALAVAAVVRFRRPSVARAPAGRSAIALPPAAFLPGVSVADWAPLLAREPVEIIAGVLPALPPAEVSAILAELEPVVQREVLERVPAGVLDDRRLAALRRKVRAEVKSQAVAALPRDAYPNSLPSTTRTPALNETAGFSLFTFDQLAKLDEASLQTLASRVQPDVWSAALVGASPKLHRRLPGIHPDARVAPGRPDRRPLRLREIEAAQRQIVDEWRALQPQ